MQSHWPTRRSAREAHPSIHRRCKSPFAESTELSKSLPQHFFRMLALRTADRRARTDVGKPAVTPQV